MKDPEVLREEARALRAGAAAIREKGHGFDDQVRAIRRHYPLPSPTLWQGPNASTFDDRLERVTSELAQVDRDLDRYADDCEATARSKETEAAGLEQVGG